MDSNTFGELRTLIRCFYSSPGKGLLIVYGGFQLFCRSGQQKNEVIFKLIRYDLWMSPTPRIQSFPFSADERARVLILGSMPGAESLKQQQYYAHPRNLFWDFMGEMFGAGRELPYEERLAVLRDHRVALWDVAHSCVRPGSLDSKMTAVEVNDFDSLFATAPNIQHVFFNGQKAAALFRKLALPNLSRELELTPLPSTSPANASMPLRKKREAWKQILQSL